MIQKAHLRLAHKKDASQILEIYSPAVTNREVAISFEAEIPSLSEMETRISQTLQKFPWLVYEKEGEILGYAYGNSHRSRSAYGWCTEVSVYVDPQAKRQGIGRQLYSTLFEILKQQGFINAYAGITLPNAASVRIHESFGFKNFAIFKSIGYKFDKPHDVGWWQLELQPWPRAPQPPLSLDQLNLDTVKMITLIENCEK